VDLRSVLDKSLRSLDELLTAAVGAKVIGLSLVVRAAAARRARIDGHATDRIDRELSVTQRRVTVVAMTVVHHQSPKQSAEWPQ